VLISQSMSNTTETEANSTGKNKTGSVLSEQVKTEIQEAYTRLLDAKGYKARYCQKLMIAEIARTLGNIETDEDGKRLSQSNSCVVEAGTGTGKTIAYALAALPVAKAAGKKLVISTATVALQEQVTYQDLPDIRKHANLDVTFALAKGRRRYLCLARLDRTLQQTQELNQPFALFADEEEDFDRELYQTMLERLGRGEWNGDRDDWPDEIQHQTWAPISTDHSRCTGRQCSHYENCIFYRAREQIHRVDCIVANHDLVLADLVNGGGAVLPAPEDTIYVFDEGHHLPEKATNHFSSFLRLHSTQQWLEQLPAFIHQLEASVISKVATYDIEQSIADSLALLNEMRLLVQEFQEKASGGDRPTYRFQMGAVPQPVKEVSIQLAHRFEHLSTLFMRIKDNLEERSRHDAATDEQDYFLAMMSGISARLESSVRLWILFSQSDSAELAPYARWLVFIPEEKLEIQFHASPVSVDDILQELLWERSFGVVVTSATLSVGGDFSRFIYRSGIPPGSQFVTLPSPFNFYEQGVLRIPAMNVEPSEPDAHTTEIASMIPDLVINDRASLVLFTSWRQLLGAMTLLDEEFSTQVLRQGVLTRSEIIRIHRERIDQGRRSCIFGLASFAEGIDLPGNYCNHVIICKIPFSVPDDPVGATLAEWIDSRGGNSFEEVMLPDAALKMVQACGRLLRTESDHGTVTILDRRLVSKRYGSRLQRALPTFRREIERE
jgi:ATP-dependent DNA helicase DinG